MVQMKKMTDIDLEDKRVLIREDLNVPMKDGKITNDARLRAAIPTLQKAVSQNAAVIVISHLGRPKEGEYDPALSLEPVAKRLSEMMNRPIRFEREWINGVSVGFGDIVLCENVRFLAGEKANDEELSKKMAKLCDVFVMDAFATAHRAQASTCGVAQFAEVVCAGPLLVAEVEALERVLKEPRRPMVAIIGGSKVSTKLNVLHSLIKNVDQLIVGGGIANTFLAATGFTVGKSLYEPDLIDTAKDLLKFADRQGVDIPLPVDAVVAKEISDRAVGQIKDIDKLDADDIILDVGPKTVQNYLRYLTQAGTVLWNGPVGMFEIEAFSHGTEKLAKAVASSSAFAVVGGGDTIAAIEQFGLEERIACMSTGGGAFLEFCEGKSLPGIQVLTQRMYENKS